jgi:hypothetical protein
LVVGMLLYAATGQPYRQAAERRVDPAVKVCTWCTHTGHMVQELVVAKICGLKPRITVLVKPTYSPVCSPRMGGLLFSV